MASVHDVAAYILGKTGQITAMKLQKLAYYSQAWHMVWEDDELFPEDFQAWANGPISPALWPHHRGLRVISEWPDGNVGALTDTEKASVDLVLDHYGTWTAYQLSQKTHQEGPWKWARNGLPNGAKSTEVISKGSMVEYYLGL